ncbi:hypothetical protein HNE05_08485 [Aquipseudomonas campi]|uniref:Immunity protein 50 n=1 Tax=Aquipseudomonas campi TaxID=2731681 RepID=A0A6M8FEX7_9GAMM|nr:Imm50 family immunity protein [Pseudomonas campi]QKE63397.1 hypothetical protein HNE05_08485 [Pseudomonas campi]
MRIWNQLEGNKLFNIVFSYPVEIDKIELFSLTLENDQPKLIMQFDILSLPDIPPPKWGRFNRCRLGLYCLSVSELLVKNIPCKEQLDISIEHTSGSFYIKASNSTSLIEFKAKFVSLSGPSVYLNGGEA